MHPALLAPLAALPWLQGFFTPSGATEAASPDVVEQLTEWREADADCVATMYGGLALRADVAESEGKELVLASYTQGVFVLDRERHLLAQAPPFDCQGSSDELVALAVGDGVIGTPLVALAASKGGRNENVTWLTLYRVSNGGELQPVFIGEVERHDGDTTRTGVITLVPGGLIYRDPQGSISIWIYDAGLGRYTQEFTNRPLA